MVVLAWGVPEALYIASPVQVSNECTQTAYAESAETGEAAQAEPALSIPLSHRSEMTSPLQRPTMENSGHVCITAEGHKR